MRRCWSLIQGDAIFMRRVNGWLTIIWAAMMPISIMMGWIYLTAFVSVVSIYANMMGHWSTWQAARVEVKQDIAEQKLEDE